MQLAVVLRTTVIMESGPQAVTRTRLSLAVASTALRMIAPTSGREKMMGTPWTLDATSFSCTGVTGSDSSTVDFLVTKPVDLSLGTTPPMPASSALSDPRPSVSSLDGNSSVLFSLLGDMGGDEDEATLAGLAISAALATAASLRDVLLPSAELGRVTWR